MGDNQAALHVEWPSGVAGAQCDECLRFTIVRPSGRDLFGDPTGWTCRPCALGLDDDFGSEGGGLDG